MAERIFIGLLLYGVACFSLKAESNTEFDKAQVGGARACLALLPYSRNFGVKSVAGTCPSACVHRLFEDVLTRMEE